MNKKKRKIRLAQADLHTKEEKRKMGVIGMSLQHWVSWQRSREWYLLRSLHPAFCSRQGIVLLLQLALRLPQLRLKAACLRLVLKHRVVQPQSILHSIDAVIQQSTKHACALSLYMRTSTESDWNRWVLE